MAQTDPAGPSQRPLRILFVCSGNTCRSPMAEVLTRELAREAVMDHIEVRSAGTGAVLGFPASSGAQRAVGRHGLSLAGHSSTPLTPDVAMWADRILTMSPGHLRRVREMVGEGHASLLGAFAKGEEDDEAGYLAVRDPFGGDDRVYEDTYQELREYVVMVLKRLASEGSA